LAIATAIAPPGDYGLGFSPFAGVRIKTGCRTTARQRDGPALIVPDLIENIIADINIKPVDKRPLIEIIIFKVTVEDNIQ
jgi:hypothetical protein